MLILMRWIEESLIIGDDITVTVPSINGNQVRLGIQAPREVAVHREEIYRRLQPQAAVAVPAGVNCTTQSVR